MQVQGISESSACFIALYVTWIWLGFAFAFGMIDINPLKKKVSFGIVKDNVTPALTKISPAHLIEKE